MFFGIKKETYKWQTNAKFAFKKLKKFSTLPLLDSSFKASSETPKALYLSELAPVTWLFNTLDLLSLSLSLSLWLDFERLLFETFLIEAAKKFELQKKVVCLLNLRRVWFKLKPC